MDTCSKNKTNTQPIAEDLFQKYWNKVGCCLCLSGKAQVLINGKTYELTRGCLYMITPLIQIQYLTPSDDFESITFMEDVKVFFPTFHLMVDSGIPLYIREHPCQLLSETEIAFLEKQYQRIQQKRLQLQSLSNTQEQILLGYLIQTITKETMIEITFNMLHQHMPLERVVNKKSKMVYEFIVALHAHYQTERSVIFYANRAQLSPGHFTHIIKSETGKTPSEWTTLFTLAYAKFRLEKSDQRIKEIAEELHFPEQFTFRKYFKRHTGMSPSEYRNKMGKS